MDESRSILQSNASALNSAIPRTTKYLGLAAAFFSVVSAVPGVGPSFVKCFSLVPQSTIGKFFVWNVTTAGFFETQLPAALMSIPLFVLLGRWIEPIWGAKELAVTAIVVNTAAGTATFVAMFIFYVATRSQRYIFTPIGGLSALVSTLIVAKKQISPDQPVGYLGAAVASKHVPLIAFALLVVASAMQIVRVGDFVFTSCGLLFGWLYLRFFQKREHMRGDLSESFALQTFFPEPVASVVGVVSAVAFPIFKPILMSAQDGSVKDLTGIVSSVHQSSADPVDAERRRQRAQRALDERMGTSKTSIGGSSEAV